MLDRSPRRSVSNFRDRVGGGSVNMVVRPVHSVLIRQRMMQTQNGSTHSKRSKFLIASVGIVGLVAPLLLAEFVLWILLRIEWMYDNNTMQGRMFYYLPMIVPSSLASMLAKWFEDAPTDAIHCAVVMVILAVTSLMFWWACLVMAMNTNIDPRPLLPFWIGIVGFLQLWMNYQTIRVFGKPNKAT